MKLIGYMLFILCLMFGCDVARMIHPSYVAQPTTEVKEDVSEAQRYVATWGRFKGLREDEIPTLVELYSNMDEVHKGRLVRYAIGQLDNQTNKYETCYELGEGMFSVGLEYCF